MFRVTSVIFILAAMTQIYALPKVEELLSFMDERYSDVTDYKANVVVTQQKVGQGTKKLEMLFYRRDTDKSFLIVMTGPASEQGNGYLRSGDNMWMYRRNTRTFQHINRDESIGGSDAKADDFEGKKLVEMYGPALDDKGNEVLSEDTLGKIPVYRFEVKAKLNDVDYPKKIYWIRRDTRLLLKEQSFSLSGTLMQTTLYTKYADVKGKLVPVQMLTIDEFEKGNKSIVELSGISIDKLDSEIFNKAYLENLSK